MGITEIILIALGLSMDAFAVAMCKGLGMARLNRRSALVIALFFGGFQAAMPLLGWLLGKQFEAYITAVDHWIAFALLALIGGKMIFDALRGGESQAGAATDRLDYRELLLMAVATSIDALAVGVTFAFLQVAILRAISLIGAITFALSYLGVVVGFHFGARFEKKAQLAGGATLILIGLKILLEHLGLLAL